MEDALLATIKRKQTSVPSARLALLLLIVALLALVGLLLTDNDSGPAHAQRPAIAHANTPPLNNRPWNLPANRLASDVSASVPLTCGLAWRAVNSPSPGTNYNTLYDVTAVSPTDIWAVGYYCTGQCSNTQDTHTLIEHWDGLAWSVVPSPALEGSDSGLFAAVALSANNVWAGGTNCVTSACYTLIEHWDGSAWSVVPSPNVGDATNHIYGMAAVSANDIWAVGYYSYNKSTLALHWDGNQWSVVPSPNYPGWPSYLNSVDAISANDVWAVGYYGFISGDLISHALVLHWDGLAWTIVPISEVPGGDYLNAVSALSSTDIWAVGAYHIGRDFDGMAAHWNGATWTRYSFESVPGFNILNAVEAIATNDVWAVDGAFNLHWDGTTWTPYPSAGGGQGVAALSSTDIWAVGYSSSGQLTRIQHYSDPCVLVGHATWQGRPAQPSPLQQLPITVTLKMGTTEINFPPTTTDSRGYLSLSTGELPPGTYSWRAKGSKYLANAGTLTIPATQLEIGLMRAGDSNNDNLVNAADLAIMQPAFGRTIGNTRYDDRAEFTGDEIINVLDFMLLRGNFGQGGAPPIAP